MKENLCSQLLFLLYSLFHFPSILLLYSLNYTIILFNLDAFLALQLTKCRHNYIPPSSNETHSSVYSLHIIPIIYRKSFTIRILFFVFCVKSKERTFFFPFPDYYKINILRKKKLKAWIFKRRKWGNTEKLSTVKGYRKKFRIFVVLYICSHAHFFFLSVFQRKIAHFLYISMDVTRNVWK